MIMIDFHSHILPGIDDGSKNIETTMQMLRLGAAQGVDTFVATPHYNFENHRLHRFLEKRENALESVVRQAKIENFELQNIVPAAEVQVTPFISECEGLERLCLAGTNCILLEMPMTIWTDWVFNEIYKICNRNLIPVMAHLERYSVFPPNLKKIEHLTEMEVCIQVNASDIGKLHYRKIIDKFFKSGNPVVLGSDTHNMTFRKIELEKGIRKLKNRYGERAALTTDYNAGRLISGEFLF